MAEMSVIKAIKLWFFILGLSFFVIIGSIAVHEIGHALVAHASGCVVESITLFSPQSNPTTYISCEEEFSQVFVGVAGMAFNFLFGIMFLFANKRLMNDVAFMFFGFGLYSAKMDLVAMGFPALVGSLLSLIGVGLMIYSLYLLCKTESLDLFRVRRKLEGGVSS
jgi:hypothetical protein